MLTRLGRHRTRALFLLVLLAQVLLVSAQATSRSGVPLLEEAMLGLLGRVQGAASATVGVTERLWSGYVALRGVRTENQALRQQVADLQVQLQEQRALAGRAHTLQSLLDLRLRTGLQTMGAEVIATDASPWFQSLTIGKGTADGLRRDMAVICPKGVVGRIVGLSDHAARVQLLVDRNAAVGALIERSRAVGVAAGNGSGLLYLEYVSNLADVAVGDSVITSGMDALYPKGYVIGRVERAERGVGFYRRIEVRPQVDFYGLESVLVVLELPPSAEITVGTE